MDLFSLESGKRFNISLGTLINNRTTLLSLGRMCQSGFGFIENATTALCVELANITSGADNHRSGLPLQNGTNLVQNFKNCTFTYNYTENA
jgi:hypothetical protein